MNSIVSTIVHIAMLPQLPPVAIQAKEDPVNPATSGLHQKMTRVNDLTKKIATKVKSSLTRRRFALTKKSKQCLALDTAVSQSAGLTSGPSRDVCSSAILSGVDEPLIEATLYGLFLNAEANTYPAYFLDFYSPPSHVFLDFEANRHAAYFLDYYVPAGYARLEKEANLVSSSIFLEYYTAPGYGRLAKEANRHAAIFMTYYRASPSLFEILKEKMMKSIVKH